MHHALHQRFILQPHQRRMHPAPRLSVCVGQLADVQDCREGGWAGDQRSTATLAAATHRCRGP